MYILMVRYDEEPSIHIYENKREALEGIEEFGLKPDMFADSLDNGDISFTSFPGQTAYLIKGELVVPKEKKVVTEITID